MARGSKRLYTQKQKRKAQHIEEGYEKRGLAPKQAARRAWMTVNKESHGGEFKGGSGYGKPESHESSRRGGRVSMARRTRAQRSTAAKKAAVTRTRKATLTRRRRSVAAKRGAAKRR